MAEWLREPPPAGVDTEIVAELHAERSLAAPESQPSQSAPKVKARMFSAKELMAQMQADAYCAAAKDDRALAEALPIEYPKKKALIYRALSQLAGEKQLDRCALALLANSRADILRATANNERKTCRLVRALFLTEQWSLWKDAPPPSAAEQGEGLAQLSALSAEDPQNGFFPLFELGALPLAEKARRLDAYQRFLRAEYFENPLTEIHLDMRRLGHQNATTWLFAAEIVSAVGGPNYAKAQSSAMEFAKDREFPEEFSRWRRVLGENFKQADKLGLYGPETDILADAIRRGIALKGSIAAEVPPILRQENWVPYFRRRVGLFDATGMVDFNAPCEQAMRSLQEQYPELKEKETQRLAAFSRR